MLFSFLGLSASAIFQIVAMALVLALEFRGTDRRWRIGVVVLAILGTAMIGFIEWRQQVANSELAASEKKEQNAILGKIGIDVEPIEDISNTSRYSLSEIQSLKQENAIQRSVISNLSNQVQKTNNQFLAAQEKVVLLSQQIVVLQQQSDRNSIESAAANRNAAAEARRQTDAINIANAQSACAASYKEDRTGNVFSSTQYPVDLTPFGGGSCLNGGYIPPRKKVQ